MTRSKAILKFCSKLLNYVNEPRLRSFVRNAQFHLSYAEKVLDKENLEIEGGHLE
jgi:hypothetical protein